MLFEYGLTMIYFNWPIIIVTTLVLYVMTILSLPFSNVAATIWLFSLIGFWSRLPGVCIYEPVSIMYLMDFVDIFSIIIAIYVGPFQGAAFALVWNIYPRLAGWFREYISLAKDAVSQAVLCFICPMLYKMTGDLLMVVVIYSVVRLILFWLASLIVPTRSLIVQTLRLIWASFALFLINGFYAKIFGDFFSNLLMEGASFSWTLFFIATIVILVFAIVAFGFSPQKIGKSMGKNIKKIVKHQIHKSTASRPADTDEIRLINESIDKKQADNKDPFERYTPR